MRSCTICDRVDDGFNGEFYTYELNKPTVVCKYCSRLIPQYLLLDEKLSHSRYLKISIDCLKMAKGEDLNNGVYGIWYGHSRYYCLQSYDIDSLVEIIRDNNHYDELIYIIIDGVFNDIEIEHKLIIKGDIHGC
jgi:hypothetical protein